MIRARGAAKTYAVKYVSKGRQRIFTLGRHGALTPDIARSMAREVLLRVARGEDPQAEREAESARGHMTFSDLADRYLSSYAKSHKRPRSVQEDERLLNRHLRPKLGRLDICAITRADFYAMRDAMAGTPIVFNRVRALASKMFALAEKWGLREQPNPVRHVDKFPERKRERFLSSADYAKLFAALDAAEGKEHHSVLACVRLLALTGARLSEILTLKWDWVDMRHGLLRLPDSKTGAKVIPLAAPALDVLTKLPRLSAYVLPGQNLNAHFVGIQRPWRRIRTAAGLGDLRLHDLRHGFASLGAARNVSLKILGGVLGHRNSATTERYAHLSTSPLHEAAEMIAGEIAAAKSLSSPSSK
jgi:integrase